MFAGIDIAAERHMLARLDAEGRPIGNRSPSARIEKVTRRCCVLSARRLCWSPWKRPDTTGRTCSPR